MDDASVDALYEQVRAAMPSSATSATQDAVPATLTWVAPGIRMLALRTPTLPPATHTNVYVVGPDAGPVAVVDPGSPYPSEQEALDRAVERLRPAAVLLTHHHGDHVGGATAFAERWSVPVIAHPATAARLAGRVAVTGTLDDGEALCGATAVFTPGHADGHLCYAVGDAIIAGDMVAGVGMILIDPREGDMAVYLASLERLLGRPPMALLPAHGPMIVDGHAKLSEYLAHRRLRESKVVAALADQPRSVAELVTDVYSDTPQALWRLAERPLLAHLIKLAREHRAIDAGDGRWSR